MVETETRTKSHAKEQNLAAYGGEFESYLISALNDSLIKKSKSYVFTVTVLASNMSFAYIRPNQELAVHKLVGRKR